MLESVSNKNIFYQNLSDSVMKHEKSKLEIKRGAVHSTSWKFSSWWKSVNKLFISSKWLGTV